MLKSASVRFVRLPVRRFSTASLVFQKLRNDISVSGKGEDELEITVKPIPRINEPIETKRARLLYQSRKRGILETDLLLLRFAAKYLKSMTLEELEEYDRLLDLPDWDIYYWATKNFEVTPLKEEWKKSEILARLQDFSLNNPKKEILRMPEIN